MLNVHELAPGAAYETAHIDVFIACSIFCDKGYEVGLEPHQTPRQSLLISLDN
jgi:hypothetical protein